MQSLLIKGLSIHTFEIQISEAKSAGIMISQGFNGGLSTKFVMVIYHLSVVNFFMMTLPTTAYLSLISFFCGVFLTLCMIAYGHK